MVTKRVYELKYGDVFTYTGKKREVVKVENGFIYAKTHDSPGNTATIFLGWHSKEIVEYHPRTNEV